MTALQTRAAIHTIAGTQEVLVVVIIVHTTDVRNHTSTSIASTYRFRLLTIGNIIFVGSGEVGGISREIITILVVNLIA